MPLTRTRHALLCLCVPLPPLQGHTTAPVPCPVLGACTREMDTQPDWSMLGVLLMLLLLLLLLMLLEYLRVSGRCRRKAQTEEEDVMQLIEAVGFKVRPALNMSVSVPQDMVHCNARQARPAARIVVVVHTCGALHNNTC